MSLTNIEDAYPLSPTQQGMLFHSRMAPDSSVYIEQMCFELHGALNVAAFTQAWQQVINRHPVLRSACVWENLEKPLQIVGKQVTFPWQDLDWRGISTIEQQEKLALLLREDRQRGFKLSQAPLMRLMLIRLADNIYHFTWSHHHLLLDGWSVPIICKEAIAYYKAFCAGENLYLPRPRPYRDYIAWLQQQDISQAENFWRNTFLGFTSPTPLGINQANHQLNQNYSEEELKLSANTTANLNSFVKQHQLTLNTLVQAGWGLLLSRYSSEQDVVFGATVSGRPPDLINVESMVGLFINTLPVRVQVNPKQELLIWLQQIFGQQIEARQYEYTSLVNIQKWSQVASSQPLFDSIVVFENYPVDAALAQPDLNVEIKNIQGFDKTNYPLNLSITPGRELLFKLAYQENEDFNATTINRILGHLQTLLEDMVSDPQQRLEQLSILTPAERQQLLIEWNDTQAEFPETQCIHHLFESQVEQTPDALAVVCKGEQLTYRELNNRANQLAHHLQALGVEPEVLVGIYVEPSLEMLVGILGILKAGGAYLPLDSAYPEERLALMLADANPKVLLTQKRFIAIPTHQAKVIYLDTDLQYAQKEHQQNPLTKVTSENLAYLIYTSGSTGTPKGVLITHQALVNHSVAVAKAYQLQQSDKILQFASISFDVAAEELFPTWLSGATVVIRPEQVLDFHHFQQFLTKQQLTVLNLPTAYWHEWVSHLTQTKASLPASLRLVIAGTEQASAEKLALWQQLTGNRIKWLNAYGPTEATIGATIYAAKPENLPVSCVPVGRPIANTQIYILDQNLQPVPISIQGELYISGACLARGYLNQPELTAEKFISNPFNNSKFNRLYKTGDLARYLANGDIEILGRIDQQVKIRGFRIELGEIETRLSQHPHIRQTVVIARENNLGEKQLVAYINPNKQTPTVSELRSFLQTKLPPYMLPSAFVTLPNFPLTPNGKIDRQALPAPETLPRELEIDRVIPQTELEKSIANIWQNILKIENLGIHDNFFELGGHSLLIAKVHSQIHQLFPTNLSILDLFRYPTISTLAEYLNQSQNQTSSINTNNIQTEKITAAKAQQKKRLQKMKSITNNQKHPSTSK
jgi:amino acid adenylation domain-containing protein